MAFDMDMAEVENYHRLLVDDVQIPHRHCLVEELRDCKAEGQMRNSLYFAIKVKNVLRANLIPTSSLKNTSANETYNYLATNRVEYKLVTTIAEFKNNTANVKFPRVCGSQSHNDRAKFKLHNSVR